MELFIKTFDELTKYELYDILKERTAIFVVEQNCPYQEIDDLDQRAIHVWISEDGKILSYVRVFSRSDTCAQIGRVISTRRRSGFGTAVMKEGIRIAKDVLKKKEVYIEAQCYAIPFYEGVGFRVTSEEFLEDGIPHVQMMLTL